MDIGSTATLWLDDTGNVHYAKETSANWLDQIHVGGLPCNQGKTITFTRYGKGGNMDGNQTTWQPMTRKRYKQLLKIAEKVVKVLDDNGITSDSGEGCKIKEMAEELFKLPK